MNSQKTDEIDFALKMYQSEEAKRNIAMAMISRLEKNLWNCIQDITGGEK